MASNYALGRLSNLAQLRKCEEKAPPFTVAMNPTMGDNRQY